MWMYNTFYDVIFSYLRYNILWIIGERERVYMKVSLNWLNELVDLSDIEVDRIAHELTMSGLEVEAVEELKPQFSNIITARI